MVRRGAVYYFRVRIPSDLLLHFGKAELCRSLRTADHRKARTLVKLEAARAEITFERMRDKGLTKDELRKIVDDYLHSTLQECEDMRASGLLTLNSDDTEGQLLGLSDFIDKCRGALSAIDVKQTRESGLKRAAIVIDPILKERGLTLSKVSEEYAYLSRELLKRAIEVACVESERIQGNYRNDYDRGLLYRREVPPEESQLLEKVPGALLSEVIKAHVNEHVTFKKWTAKTELEYSGMLDVFLELVGDRDITTITHQELLNFRDNLVKLPANHKKGKAMEGKTLQEIIELGLPPMSLTTVRKYLTRISTFFKWAYTHKHTPSNEAMGITISKPKRERASSAREIYSREDLSNLFHALQYDPHRPERFWIPIIALYSGMRLNEICQLHLEDMTEVDQIPCFRVNEEGNKRVKTTSSLRTVPVHPVLIDLGFMQYVQKLKDRGAVRLWENLKLRRDGYGQDFGKWYQGFNRNEITDNRKKVFHSFRHGVTDALKQAGVPESVVKEIVGHEDQSITFGRYGKNYRPVHLLEALNRLEYGVDLESLKDKIPKELNS
jgi:integrase